MNKLNNKIKVETISIQELKKKKDIISINIVDDNVVLAKVNDNSGSQRLELFSVDSTATGLTKILLNTTDQTRKLAKLMFTDVEATCISSEDDVTEAMQKTFLKSCLFLINKPILDNVVTFGAGHFYCSQSDKGELVMGGDLDGYNSYSQRGNLPTLQHVLTEGIAMFPFLSKLKMLRTWGGIMAVSYTHLTLPTNREV